jgi:iron complex outermembrane receptor protein
VKTSLPALACALTISAPAMAQKTNWTPADTIIVTGKQDKSYATPDAATLRTPVPIQQTPQSVQVLTRNLIDEQGLTTLAEALRNVSGVVPAQPSEAVLIKPIVRGFASEVYVDGLAQYGDASTYDPSSLVGVERIEVAKGPSSLLFGGGTGAPVGGLINVVSASPQQKASYAASFRTGSFATVQPAVDINQPIGPNVAARVAAEYVSSDDAIDYVTNRRITVAPSLRIGFDDTSLILRANYSFNKQQEYAGLPFELVGNPKVNPFHFSGAKDAPKTTIENIVLTAEFNHRFSDQVSAQLRARSYQNTVNEFGSFPYLAFYPSVGLQYPIITAIMPNVRIKEISLDGSLTGKFKTGALDHVVIAGASYDLVDYHGTMGFNLFPVGTLDYADPNSTVSFGPTDYYVDKYVNTYRTLGLYAQDQITLGPVHVLAGLRYSRLETTEGFNNVFSPKHGFNRVDPRLGVTLDVAQGVSLFGGYATGSRAAVFFNPSTTPSSPVTASSWEGGLKFALKQAGLSGTLALFEQKRNHVPISDPLGLAGTRQIGQQRSRGVEADFIWEPAKSFSLLASYAYTRAQVTKDDFSPASVGQQLSRVPEHSGRIAARYRFLDGKLKGLGLGAGMTAASGSQTTLPNSDKTGSYAVFDAQASYDLGRWRISISGQNLTNKLYFLPYLYLNQSVVRPANPRSGFVTLSVKY